MNRLIPIASVVAKNRRIFWMLVSVLVMAIVVAATSFAVITSDSSSTTGLISESSSSGSPEYLEETTPYVDGRGMQELDPEPALGSFGDISSMSLSIEGNVAAIDPVQVTDTGTLIPPIDVNRLGWYSASARPGEYGSVGSSVITGHVNSRVQGDGYARRFVDLTLGDKIVVNVDGSNISYRVSESPFHVEKGGDLPDVVNSDRGNNLLVLITCGGDFVGGDLGYSDNIVTVAMLDI